MFIGKLAGLELRVNQFLVGAQLKTPAAGRDQLQVLNLLFVRAQQLARQTDGLRLVVSHRAVLKLQVHALLLSVPRSLECHWAWTK